MRRPTKTHLIRENATHALDANLIHPRDTLELVVVHLAAHQTLRLLGHLQVMLTERLTIESRTHAA